MNRSKPLLKREDASCGMTTAQGRYNAFKAVEELCLRGGQEQLTRDPKASRATTH